MPLPASTRAGLAALGAPVVNYLAATETGPIAWECLVEAGRFHVLHPDVWVEAEGGQLDVTRLRDSPLPLLRYRTGDRGAVEDGVCACGVRGRSIVGLEGRSPAPFLRPDGVEIDGWSLAWLMKDIPLCRFELCQVGPEAFALTVDPELPMDLELLCGRLRLALARLGFPAPSVSGVRAARPQAPKPRPFVNRYQSMKVSST
jgi:phenylacetate-CoA ligase